MDFTKAEIERINMLYGTDFQDIKPEDATLIARWEQHKALQEAEYKAKVETMQAESQARIEQSKALADKALENLEAQQAIALKRLEVFKHVQEK